jgi:hypothetical protein
MRQLPGGTVTQHGVTHVIWTLLYYSAYTCVVGVKYHDPVRSGQHVQLMRDQNPGPRCKWSPQYAALEKVVADLSVHSRKRIIQEYDARLGVCSPSQTEPLPLATRERSAALANFRAALISGSVLFSRSGV